MNNTFQKLFDPIQADDELKNRTKAFLVKKTQNYTKTNIKKRKYQVYALACACTLLMLLGGQWLYFTPTTEISIDINPSIELSINRFDRVISVGGFNEDGQKLSDALNVKYKDYAEAMEQILQQESIKTLLSDGEVMTITVIGSDEQQSAKILSGVESCTANQSNTYCYFALPEEVAAAHEMGFSCGKYRAFLELQLLEPNITAQTVQNMTMREIRELIKSLSSEKASDFPPYDDRENGHHGNGRGWRHGWSEQDLDK